MSGVALVAFRPILAAAVPRLLRSADRQREGVPHGHQSSGGIDLRD